jgi:hypothetical protein
LGIPLTAKNAIWPLFEQFQRFFQRGLIGTMMANHWKTITLSIMKKAAEKLVQMQKVSESLVTKGLKKVTHGLEELIVHKTQTERRKAFFGEDPLARVN